VAEERARASGAWAGAGAVACGVAIAVAVVGCDKEPPVRPRDEEPATASGVARALGLDAATLAAPSDPPSPAGDVKAEVERFTTLDACVSEHAKTDPLVGDALRAIGYDTFLRDACRMLQAMKEKKTDACKAIDAQGLRSKCEASVAMQEGTPDACPLETFEAPAGGRDMRCVAAASREPRLCVGTTRGERTACEALVLRDGSRCGADAACARDAARWKNALPAPASSDLGRPLASVATLVVHGAEGTAEPPVPETDLAGELARGVVIVQDFAGAHLALGAAREVGTTVFAPTPLQRTRLSLAILVGGDKPAAIEHAEVAVPGAATLVLPGARWDGALKVTKLEAKRGGEVALVLEGTLGAAPHAYAIKAQVTTFVRDVVRMPTAAVAQPKR
jgi:hypothetical protein